MEQDVDAHTCVPQSLMIVGAGAVGLAIASRIPKSIPLTVVARGERADALCRHAIAVKPFSLPPHLAVVNSLNGNTVAGQKFIILAVKAFSLEEILPILAPLLAPDQTIVVICNGLNIYFDSATHLRRGQPLVRALAYFGAYFESPGTLVCSNTLQLEIASASTHAKARDDFNSLAASAGITCTVAHNVAEAEWRKVLTNAPVNLIASAHNGPNRVIYESQEALEEFHLVTAEVRAVAAREGFNLASPTDLDILARLQLYKDNINSTLIDLRGNRPTELPHIVGRIQSLGKSYGVATPAIEKLLKKISSRFGGMAQLRHGTSCTR
ncbi:MAG: ketopantoate reductase C-terminal domain-containing protein [Bdellovibrionota bacterium]|nr:MAG: ketopantoate reductase C-terminal domain-containing protein [Bdellovibrionota bacterium]